MFSLRVCLALAYVAFSILGPGFVLASTAAPRRLDFGQQHVSFAAHRELARHHQPLFAATKIFRHEEQAMTSVRGVKAQGGLAKRDEYAQADTQTGELNHNQKTKHDGDGDKAKPDKSKKPCKTKQGDGKPNKSKGKGDKTKPGKNIPEPSSNSTSSSSPTKGGSSNSTPQSNSTTGTTAGCTFSNFDALVKGRDSCKHIVLDGIKVPAGATLDLNNLTVGTQITFAGTTTFAYKEWLGECLIVSQAGDDR